ncbi:cytoplasmic protein [Desulfovibrio sulfodismutans]|uniref:Cytoplasmic protein n=1 Tax=Desulfolutivibrio sulfodismutans TaxID=63561 RepID=A0A7K3NS45_9BACT|nr:DsrE family protein [Desulfolutivibrio sulfodismutans]NDY59010.1 cytoplasmic protein [Desulfolutivibrio sulfodismutans]QLA11594.1 cytoplasmic protein [Desulfolutivibrio sulfodismutans DSM 3696]
MKKVAIFAFRGDMMCFIHVLLNAIDMREKGFETLVILEGAATTLVEKLADESNPMHKLFEKTKALGLFAGACKACATNLGALEAVKKEGFTLLDDMHGHPGMAKYMDDGYQIITF